jgi:hypothetical protein
MNKSLTNLARRYPVHGHELNKKQRGSTTYPSPARLFEIDRGQLGISLG